MRPENSGSLSGQHQEAQVFQRRNHFTGQSKTELSSRGSNERTGSFAVSRLDWAVPVPATKSRPAPDCRPRYRRRPYLPSCFGRRFAPKIHPRQPLTRTRLLKRPFRRWASAPPVSAQVYQAILPSIVVVRTESSQEGENPGIGSGVVVSDNADVLTALHVLQGVQSIQLGFADGTVTPGFISNVDAARDIAVLRPWEMPNLVVPATVGSSSALRVGDQVFAVGNPLGLVASLSAGVVSGPQPPVPAVGQGCPPRGRNSVRRRRESGQFRRSPVEQSRSGCWNSHRVAKPL